MIMENVIYDSKGITALLHSMTTGYIEEQIVLLLLICKKTQYKYQVLSGLNVIIWQQLKVRFCKVLPCPNLAIDPTPNLPLFIDTEYSFFYSEEKLTSTNIHILFFKVFGLFSPVRLYRSLTVYF